MALHNRQLFFWSFVSNLINYLTVTSELNKALVMVEMGTSRDAEKLKIVLENIALLTARVHG